MCGKMSSAKFTTLTKEKVGRSHAPLGLLGPTCSSGSRQGTFVPLESKRRDMCGKMSSARFTTLTKEKGGRSHAPLVLLGPTCSSGSRQGTFAPLESGSLFSWTTFTFTLSPLQIGWARSQNPAKGVRQQGVTVPDVHGPRPRCGLGLARPRRRDPKEGTAGWSRRVSRGHCLPSRARCWTARRSCTKSPTKTKEVWCGLLARQPSRAAKCVRVVSFQSWGGWGDLFNCIHSLKIGASLPGFDCTLFPNCSLAASDPDA